MEAEKVVDIATNDEHFLLAVGADSGLDEDTAVAMRLNEALTSEPREEATLPSSAGLSHTVNWLFDADDALSSIFATLAIPRGSTAVHYLTPLKRALKERCDKIPAVHMETMLGGNRGEQAERGTAHGAAPALIVVQAGHLRAALYAETRLEFTTALSLVGPRHVHKPTTLREL